MAWATTTEADTYLNAGIDGAAFALLSTAIKTQYLESSYRMLLNDPGYGWPGTTVTAQTNANIELANYLLTNPDFTKSIQAANAGIESFEIGTFKENYRSDKDLSQLRTNYPIQVLNLIDAYKVYVPGVARITRKVRNDGKC